MDNRLVTKKEPQKTTDFQQKHRHRPNHNGIYIFFFYIIKGDRFL